MESYGCFPSKKQKLLGRVDRIPKEELDRLLACDNIFIKEKAMRKRPAPYNIKVSDSSNSKEPGSGSEVTEKIQEVFEISEIKNYYIIMDGFGDSLREVHEDHCYKFSFKSTAQIGIQLIDLLKEVHKMGYVYNDLKPDNILVGNCPISWKAKDPQLHMIRLVDFGLITPYKLNNGDHIAHKTPDKFKGSMLFASKNAFDFTMMSRRDDLIGLCYVLVYLLDENQLGFINSI